MSYMAIGGILLGLMLGGLMLGAVIAGGDDTKDNLRTKVGVGIGTVGLVALLGLVIWVGQGMKVADERERAAEEWVDPSEFYPTGPEISSGESR